MARLAVASQCLDTVYVPQGRSDHLVSSAGGGVLRCHLSLFLILKTVGYRTESHIPAVRGFLMQDSRRAGQAQEVNQRLADLGPQAGTVLELQKVCGVFASSARR